MVWLLRLVQVGAINKEVIVNATGKETHLSFGRRWLFAKS